MEFTGERYVPGAAGQEELYIEHMSRYRFVRGLAAGQRVLDVGSGCGYGAYHLATGGASLAIGIDKSPEAVAYSRRNYHHPGLSFAVMDASRLCLTGRFGLVTCFELIEHVEDAEAVLRGVRRVLDDSGVFVVSTPNKATYVAGGEDGKNPFHVREYHREEFGCLLEGIFASVKILGQHWVEGMALDPCPACADGSQARAGWLAEDRGPSRDAPPADGVAASAEASDKSWRAASSGDPPYFIALCSSGDVLDEALARLDPVAFYGRAVRYDGLKEAALRLEREFDRRGEWAMGLDREVRSRDETIRNLQRELRNLRTEFEERGRWAARLNGELRQSGALVERLAHENRRLRETLAARRPSGWSKAAK